MPCVYRGQINSPGSWMQVWSIKYMWIIMDEITWANIWHGKSNIMVISRVAVIRNNLRLHVTWQVQHDWPCCTLQMGQEWQCWGMTDHAVHCKWGRNDNVGAWLTTLYIANGAGMTMLGHDWPRCTLQMGQEWQCWGMTDHAVHCKWGRNDNVGAWLTTLYIANGAGMTMLGHDWPHCTLQVGHDWPCCTLHTGKREQGGYKKQTWTVTEEDSAVLSVSSATAAAATCLSICQQSQQHVSDSKALIMAIWTSFTVTKGLLATAQRGTGRGPKKSGRGPNRYWQEPQKVLTGAQRGTGRGPKRYWQGPKEVLTGDQKDTSMGPNRYRHGPNRCWQGP